MAAPRPSLTLTATDTTAIGAEARAQDTEVDMTDLTDKPDTAPETAPRRRNRRPSTTSWLR